MRSNTSNVSWLRQIVVACLLILLFVLIALDEGLGRAGVLVLALLGVLVQGVALVSVVTAALRRQRPGAAALASLAACIVVDVSLLFTPYSRVVLQVCAFSLIFACAVVLASGRKFP